MIFPKEFIENLKNRISVSEVVSRYVNLKSKGKGTFSGLCPFHNEKTPSFSVNDSKGFYHCFGCGAHGNAISFLIEHKGYSFPEAVKELAQLAGMELPKQDEKAIEKQKQVQSSYELMELATRYFERNFYSTHGLEARKYIEARGLTAETIKKFRIGLALDEWEGLKNHLKAQGANEDIMIANGLLAEKEESGKTYDRFRGRLIFPIFDSSNRVIAFGGRILGNQENGAKYLNSSETDLFKKSYVLYAYNFARDAGYKKSQAIVVEGYMDAISMHQAGFDNTVAPLGTAVTQNHLFHLWKMTPEPIFCLDSDEAGQRASKRLAEEFIKYLKPGYSMKFAIVPSGKDPDDFIKTEGREAMENLLNNATPLVDALWNFNIKGADLSTPEKKASFSKTMQDIANRIEDPQVREFYKAEFTERVKKQFTAPANNVVSFNKYHKFNPNKTHILSAELSAAKSVKPKDSERQEEKILLLIALYPELTKLANVEEFLQNFTSNNKNLEFLAKIINELVLNSEFEGDFAALKNEIISIIQQSHISNILNSPYINELRKIIRSEADSITAWQYFFCEYQLDILKVDLQNLSKKRDADINYLLGIQNQITNLSQLKNSYDRKYQSLTEDN